MMVPIMTITSLYASVLGVSFERLSPVLRNIHDARTLKRYIGRCDVRGGANGLARLIARIARLPISQADVPLEVTIEGGSGGEHWTRQFGAFQMQSRLRERNRRLEERIGPVVLTFELIAQEGRIVWSLDRARLAVVPLPIGWLLTCTATEEVADGRYGFDVSAHIRGVGLVIHYKGWLVERER